MRPTELSGFAEGHVRDEKSFNAQVVTQSSLSVGHLIQLLLERDGKCRFEMGYCMIDLVELISIMFNRGAKSSLAPMCP